ncbi:unnamed protein product [Oikopleura dioica]|uniref:ribonuclease H n=1 Tax=Oikopleura dioica TaxID=34765 RepID=E4XEY0_OIKDI|nr:unnamed protein product [Oikopleura dioica]
MQMEALLPPGQKYFMTADIKCGFWNIKVREEDQHKLAIQWKGTNYQFQRLPFGLKSAPSIFCRAIARCLETMQNRQNIKLYIDDICIFSETFDVFVKTIDEVFSLLTDHGFVVSPKKVFALQPEIRWLGRLISPIGSRANPENTQAILEITAPTSYKGLQRLLGMLQWIRQYAACRNKEDVASKSFSQVIKPISALLKTNTPRGKFTWTRNASKALEEIKERLASPEFIYFPDWNHTFVLTTDASIDAIGYCLTQEIEGKSQIIRVNSKTLNGAQQRYSTTERECLGVYWAILDCKFYLSGSRFIVRCDHNPLTFLDTKTPKNDKVVRWLNQLSNFIIVFVRGVDNNVADFLSRPRDSDRPTRSSSPEDSEPAGEYHKFHKYSIYVPSWVDPNADVSISMDGADLTDPGPVIYAITSSRTDIDTATRTSIASPILQSEKFSIVSNTKLPF